MADISGTFLYTISNLQQKISSNCIHTDNRWAILNSDAAIGKLWHLCRNQVRSWS